MSDTRDEREPRNLSPWDAEESAPTMEGASVAAGTPVSSPAFDSEMLRPLGQRYDLLAELGRGGMGIVYRARDRETGDVVALKILQPGIAARADLMERFKSELLLARKVTHKNVCRVHELIRLGNVAAIAMEYVEGESLRAVLKREQGVSLRYGLKLARQIISGLAEAQAQGVVHRDLKPENILIARDGTAKVMDFGIARSADAELTSEGHLAGTPAYMSPEQAQGRAADARSDIYALGLILYEIFGGAPTFSADTTTALLMKHIKEPPTPPRKLEPNLPDFLDRIILKCLAKDPQKRFQTAAEVEAALVEQRPAEAVLEEEPKPAAHHVTSGTGDVVLIGVAVAAVMCFLIWRGVYVAGKFPLELDALAARREAENVAKQLGRPFPAQAQWSAALEYRPEEYTNRLLTRVQSAKTSEASLAISRSVEPPIFWMVRFRSQQDEFAFAAESARERFARLDRKGRVVEFLNPVSRLSLGRDYRVPPVEQRREIAKKALAEVCGLAAPADAPVESYGGEGGASYSARWRQGEVSLFAEAVTAVNCEPPLGIDVGQSALAINLGLHLFRAMGCLAAVAFLVMICVAFVKGQCHNSALFWNRLPLAALVGLPSGWVMMPVIFGATPSWPAALLSGIGATAPILLGLVAAEHHLSRRMPAGIASYQLALRGRWLDPAVGLAVLRGALCGLILTGAQSALAHVSMNLSPLLADGRMSPAWVFQFWLGWHPDPAVPAYAAASSWPAVFTVLAAVFHALFVGLLMLGLYWIDVSRYVKEAGKKGKIIQAAWYFLLLLLIGANVSLIAAGLRFYFAVSLVMGFTMLVTPSFWAAFLAWVFWRYGALAAMVATATNVLWIVNYPLLHMLREVGNAPQWGVFIGWGVFVLGATALAFRGQLKQAMAAASE